MAAKEIARQEGLRNEICEEERNAGEMTVEEYKAFCLERLSGGAWLDDRRELELFQMFREAYLSGGWNDQDLDMLATMTVLFDLAECVANSKEQADRLLEVWRDLPVRDDLKAEVVRKNVIEGFVERLECVDETELSDDLQRASGVRA